MKSLVASISITALLLLGGTSLSGQQVDAGQTYKTQEFRLEFSGVMTVNETKVSDYYLYLFRDGVLSDSFFVDDRHEVFLELELNHDFAIKFVKSGYKERVILIDTHLPQPAYSQYYNFRYSIEFIPTDGPSNTFDDFPVAYITYDDASNDFDYNRTYHRNVRLSDAPDQASTAGN